MQAGWLCVVESSSPSSSSLPLSLTSGAYLSCAPAPLPLQKNPAVLVSKPYNAQSALPYLFKVLSVAKALSVQAHPDKALAERLFAERPDVYKDDNHKPEMACAVTPFKAMCGFRPAAEIAHYCRAVPELQGLMGEEAVAGLEAAAAAVAAGAELAVFKAALKAAYGKLMSATQEEVAAAAEKLAVRLAAKGVKPSSSEAEEGGESSSSSSSSISKELQLLPAEEVAAMLCQQYPGDVGVFSPFLLNCMQLSPGQAIFLGANIPHAYLAGDCMEAMATSDNVVRAGLTPKLKDVPTLVQMLTYDCGLPMLYTGEPVEGAAGAAGAAGEASSEQASTLQYRPPVSEFLLQRTLVKGRKEGGAAAAGSAAGGAAEGAGATTVSVSSEGGYVLPQPATSEPAPSVLLVYRGKGRARQTEAAGGEWQPLQEGEAWLLAAGVEVAVQAEGEEELLLYRCLSNKD